MRAAAEAKRAAEEAQRRAAEEEARLRVRRLPPPPPLEALSAPVARTELPLVLPLFGSSFVDFLI